ncbi:nucleotidyl transferase AbiEii/AbiGii toxin family protein [Acetobacterium malicum]|uniref:nucleotidyl transferase AbiEii/AbiGii toxin family protein n=1 Tax=Acetobacterium malicum TaxID=52692 RepID=UPI0003FC0AB2|nr:nucleotidyl transferase AbiEii/AbiGii toxin family protein [Acetobacterium dehalogenans]
MVWKEQFIGFRYLIQSITEFKEYHGINVSVLAYLDKTKIPISIDIGFGDVVHPDRVLMDFPVLLDMEIPTIYAYSLASAVSEKFEAIVSLGYANSRLKDFYDIYILLCNFDFDGNELCEAIIETFSHRGTRMDDIVAFEDDFADDTTRRNRWNAFVKKKRAMVIIEFSDLLISMKLFLEPVINAINKQETYEGKWISEKKIWQLF